jgi:L-ascorbate metabolism protein UlaG (beta-lactamase superfamily)
MKFTWIGGPSFRLELGPYIIIGDPVHAEEFELDGMRVRRTHVLQPVETNDADLVLVTSARADHCDVDAIARCHTDQIYGPEGVPAAIQIAPGDSVTVT